MSSSNDKSFHYFRHQLDAKQLPTNVTNLLTKRYYVNKLIFLHLFAGCLILLSGILQLVSILTTEWYILNVNEYIPNSKGGLWNYCFIGTAGHNSRYTCMRYEELPNFALFVNQRLHDSRILLVCSCGFTFFIFCIEALSLIYMLTINKKNDKFDLIIANCRLPMHQLQEQSVRNKSIAGIDENMSTNSTRFTSSFIINGTNSASYSNKIDEQINDLYNSILKKPDGYMAFIASSLINSIGGFMDFVLKVAGFGMFDSYIKYLLSYNTVFLSYRSYSYWFIVVSICVHFFYWIFKVVSARYIVNLTRKLIETRENIYSIICRARSKSMSTIDTIKETQIVRISPQEVNNCDTRNNSKNRVTNANRFNVAKNDDLVAKKTFVFDTADLEDEQIFTEDDLSSSSFSNDSSVADTQLRPKSIVSNYTNSTFVSQNKEGIIRF